MIYRGAVRVMVALLLALHPMAKLVKALLRKRSPGRRLYSFLSRRCKRDASLLGDIEWIQLVAHDRLTRALALHRKGIGIGFTGRRDFMLGRKGIWGGHIARGIK